MGRRLLFLFFVLLYEGCIGTETDNPAVAPRGVELIRSNDAYLTTVKVSTEDRQALQQGNQAFALDLYRQIASQAEEQENLFISPYAISTVMAMTYAGARGDTQSQMASALHFDLVGSALDSAMNDLARQLDELNDKEDFRFEPLNSIWVQKGNQIRESYLDLLSQYYDTGVFLADFVGDRENARQNINQWISEQTDGYLKELFPRGSIDELTGLALTNTVYLSALWQYPFDKENTSDGQFTLLSGDKITVPMMWREEKFPSVFGTDWRAVSMPYKNANVSMICILPNEGEFEQFETAFNADKLDEVLNALPQSDDSNGRGISTISLTVPKFSFDSDVDLKSALSGLGMTDAFDPNTADLSAISDDELYIATALHKTHISIDEEGTVAVAATGEIIKYAAEPQLLSLDRPFIFIIWDNDTQTVLFVGRMMRPDGITS